MDALLFETNNPLYGCYGTFAFHFANTNILQAALKKQRFQKPYFQFDCQFYVLLLLRKLIFKKPSILTLLILNFLCILALKARFARVRSARGWSLAQG